MGGGLPEEDSNRDVRLATHLAQDRAESLDLVLILVDVEATVTAIAPVLTGRNSSFS